MFLFLMRTGSGTTSAPDIDSSSQPVCSARPTPCGMRVTPRAMVPDPIWRRGCSVPEYRYRGLDGLSGLEPGSTVIRNCPGLPEGGRNPPGDYPILDGSAFGKASRSSNHRFAQCTDERMATLGGVSTKFVRPCSRMFLFQGFPEPPFSLDSLAARVLFRRWLPSSRMRSPYPSLPRPTVSGKALFGGCPMLRST